VRSVELSTVQWRKSSYSNQDGGECVEVAPDLRTAVPVRDSKRPHDPVLILSTPGCAAFIDAVRAGDIV
jgi:Domain of unknown function (DUF397)